MATQVSHLPPVSTMFAALLGYNPVQTLLAPSHVLAHLPAHNVAVLTGRQFFPHLLAAPFHHGLVIVFTAAAIMSVIGALVSLLRGKQFYYDDKVPPVTAPAARVPNGAGLPSPAPGMSNDKPAPARRDTEAAPGGLPGPAKLVTCPAMNTAAAPAATRSS